LTRAVDTSVAIAALLADHESHDLADDVLGQAGRTIAPVVAETYSVLTRLPAPLRLDATNAAAIVKARLPSPHVALEGDDYASLLERLAAAQVSGGATYDGLIALTALEHGLELLSLDRRAARTYRALGVPFQLLAD
jgi:predicted nucleic acid-binding protein